MSDESYADTIVPKSDQLNADDLLTGPITVRITSVTRGDKEQPVKIGIEDGKQDRQPYKPCKSMRRVLIAAWGEYGKDWVGKRMTLYCDPEVKWGGVKVGGIRISHLSDIPTDRTFMLTATRGRRAEYHVKRLEATTTQTTVSKPEALSDDEQAFVDATAEAMRAADAQTLKSIIGGLAEQSEAVRAALRPVYKECAEALQAEGS